MLSSLHNSKGIGLSNQGTQKVHHGFGLDESQQIIENIAPIEKVRTLFIAGCPALLAVAVRLVWKIVGLIV